MALLPALALLVLVHGVDGGGASTRATVAGLSSPVELSFDAFDVPTIAAGSETDAARALGFAHASARFAQMDMMRRFSAGETAELLGPSAVAADRERRNLRGREVAKACVDRLDAPKRAILDAYVEGVNAALAAMPSPPMEHVLLGITPAAWTGEDCALVYLAMFHSLSRTGRADAVYADASARLPPSVLAFISSPLSRMDCPVFLDWPPVALPPIPGADAIDLRSIDRAAIEPAPKPTKGAAPQRDGAGKPKRSKDRAATPVSSRRDTQGTQDWARDWPDFANGAVESPYGWTDGLAEHWNDRAAYAGSNGWVVAGWRTKDGRAILANDPHLMITAPILWYRCRLQWPGVDWTGLSIPGVPGIVIGTNGHVAMGFTNTTGDFEDLVIVDVDPSDPTRYQIPGGGSEPFVIEPCQIKVRGAEPVTHDRKMTRWGAVTGDLRCADGITRPVVTLWVGARPDAINFDVLGMARVTSVPEAVALLSHWHGPSQNAMVADDAGHIGWVVTGWIPDRGGHDPRLPWRPLVDGEPWVREIAPDKRPMVMDPPSGVIVTANHRTVPLDRCSVMGYYWAHPERARRVHELLAASDALDEQRMLEIQFDTQVNGLRPYQALAVQALGTATTSDQVALREALRSWDGTADADQAAVAVLSAFQKALERRFLASLGAWMKAQPGGEGARTDLRSVHDEPWLRLLEERPAHWLPSGFSDWDEFIRAAFAEAAEKEPGTAPWGERNRAKFASPLAEVLPPFLKSTVTIDDGPQPGHARAVRVQTPRAAASARFIVSPGHESTALLQTPGGQSGDPNSPHYRSHHAGWRDGKPVPLLPAAPARTVTLEPQP